VPINRVITRKEDNMYYHIRLGKFKHGGGEDMRTRKDWDFRSLNKALAFVKRDFGPEAEAWRIEDLTERKNDLMTLEKVLADALESGCQYLIMSFKDGSALAKKYDHYAVRRGYGDAKHVVENLREQLFVSEDRFGDEYDDDEMLDVDDVIKRYELDEVCFAGFCVCSGLGWARNMDNAEKLFEHALDNGYERASYYLNEIRAGRAWDCLWS